MAYQNNSFASFSEAIFIVNFEQMGICGVSIFRNTIFGITVYGVV